MMSLQSGNSISNWFNNYVASVDPCDPGLLPTVIRISARTIGLDLVTVKPLSAPINQIFYTDFNYELTSIFLRKRRKEKLERLQKISMRKEKLKYIEEILSKNN